MDESDGRESASCRFNNDILPVLEHWNDNQTIHHFSDSSDFRMLEFTCVFSSVSSLGFCLDLEHIFCFHADIFGIHSNGIIPSEKRIQLSSSGLLFFLIVVCKCRTGWQKSA